MAVTTSICGGLIFDGVDRPAEHLPPYCHLSEYFIRQSRYPPLQSVLSMSAKKPQFSDVVLERIKRVPQRLKEAPPKKYGKVGAALVLGGVGFGWLIFPYILSFAVGKIVTLGDGSDVRKIWKKIPQYLEFNIYLFNITNPMEVQNGGKPVLQEIGPYRYIEWKEKVNLVDDVAEDTITYSNLNTWYFLKEKSLPLTGDEMVTIPHLPLLSVLLVAEQDFPTPMLTIVNAAVPHIYGKLGSVFLTAKVRELLFDGVLIDCTAKNIVPKAICIAIKQNSKALVKLGNNKYLFSFFGIRNATPEEARITVKKGVQDVYSIGKVVAMNGNPENVVWSGGECRRFSGTDSTIFPPFRKPDNYSIIAFSPEICRTMTGVYVGNGEYQGVRGYKYEVSLGDMKRNPGEMCFCPSPDRCLGKGTTDLTKCQGAPLIGSLPHFYDAEEDYLNGVEGMNPIKEKHEIAFIMEPISGVPLLARKRLQFNIHLHPVRFINLTRKLTPTLVPIFWLEENLDLGDELMGFLEANLLTNLKLVDVVKWMLIVVGAGVCVAGVVLYRMKKEARKKADSKEDLLPPGSDDVEILDPSRLSSSTASLVRTLVKPTAPVTQTGWDMTPSPSLRLPAVETVGASPGISNSAPLEPRTRSSAEQHARLSTSRLRKF